MYNNPEAIERQIERIKRYCSIELNLNTPTEYFSQRDNFTQPHRTCNSSSNAIYLDWLMAVTKGTDLGSDDRYLRRVLIHGDTTVHEVQTKAIKDFGYSTQWITDRNYPFIEDLLKAGFPVVVNILHRGTKEAPRGGHVICLIGMRCEQFIAHDPYGTLESGYNNFNGAYSRINKSEFNQRWQGGYRILANAINTSQKPSNQENTLTQEGIELIKEFEGFRERAYLCPAGTLTIGYGTTVYEDGSKVRSGDRVTKGRAEELLRKDCQRFEADVKRLVNVPLTDNQFSALVSFTYNVGSNALAKSTLLKVLNQGNYNQASNELLRWNKANGIVLKGLVRRRENEKKLFDTI